MNVATDSASPNVAGFKGNDSALLGIVLAVVTFWLFAQTTMNIGPLMADDLGMPMPVMNIAISLAALFSGMFIVMLGGLGDRYGRVRIVFFGNLLNIAGSLLIAFAIEGGLAAIFTALATTGLEVVGAVVEFSGRQDNLAVREAGMVGLAFNALMAIAALVSVTIFIPKQTQGGAAG